MFLFNNFYETIARGRDIPVFFGKRLSMVNPYFIDLNIRIDNPEENKIYKGRSWTLVFGGMNVILKERTNTILPGNQRNRF